MRSCLVVLTPGAPAPEPLLRWSREHDVEPVVWPVSPADAEPPSSGYDSLVVVGGPTSPYDPDLPRHALGRLVSRSVTRRVPTLGTGSGAHFISWSLGADPGMPEAHPTFAVRTITRTAQGRLDPIFGSAPSKARWLDCSEMTFTRLPVGSAVLAVDAAGAPQAVRFGPSAWGFQGHPYLDRATAESMAPPRLGPDRQSRRCAGLDETLPYLDDVSRSWQPLFARFFALAGGHRRGN